MLFKRRTPLTLLQQARNILWPQMGWGRTFRYLKWRTVRIPDTAHRIAAGLAIGCAISFTPTFGTHLIQSVFFCWLLRGNWVSAFIGTAFGNPWTFPFLLWISYEVGDGVMWLFGYGYFFEDMPGPLSLDALIHYPVKYLLPMMVGGYVMAIVTFPLFYYPFYYMVKGARAARRMRIERRAHKDALKLTGQAGE